MKTILISMLTVFFLPLCVSPSFAMVGNEGGHGGDPYALEFKTLAKAVGEKLVAEENRSPALFAQWKYHGTSFLHAAQSVRVVSLEGEDMILQGQEVDGINFPSQNLIKLNRARWREGDLATRARLALHEIFGILGVERDSYVASMDFESFITRAAKEIGSEHPKGSFLVSLFYGRCLSFPSLDDADTCQSDSAKMAQAEACAKTQAEGKCRIGGRSSCRLMNMSYTPNFSTTQIGLRYCEVLVIMK